MSTVVSPVHTTILERFARLKAQNRLAHAYLFIGPQGIGKSETAFAVARMMNCLSPSGFSLDCSCDSCRKINSHNHPDIHLIIRDREEKTVITAEQMRGLISRLELRAMEAAVKVAIIREADELSVDGANTFLKTLEEPGRDTLLVLTTSAPERILATVTSRCHQVFFFPVGNAELARWVQSEYHTGSSEAAVLAGFSQGSPGRVREFGPELAKAKNEMINRFILSVSDNDAVRDYCGDKKSSRVLLDVVMAFFRDVLLVRRGLGAEYLVNADRIADLRKCAEKYSDEDIEQILGQTVTAVRGIRDNMNVKVAVMLLKEMI